MFEDGHPHPGRVLTDEDIDHYQKIVVALGETIRIMREIDVVINQHGGWPGAFVCEASIPSAESKPGQQDLLKAAEDKALYDEAGG